MLAYCDYIAKTIKDLLSEDTFAVGTLLADVGKVKMDLHPEKGYFMSTKKTIEVSDVNGKKYTITIEEK